MTLILSGQTERIVDPHREFCGRVIDEMPLLVSGKDAKGNIVDVPRIPVSFAYVLERRENAPEDVKETWQKNYFFTGDIVATGVAGDMVSAWDSPLLRSLTSQSTLQNGALVLSTEQWNELKNKKEGSLYLTAQEAAQTHQKGYVLQAGVWTPENKEVAKVWEHISRGRDLTSYAKRVGDGNSTETIMRIYLDTSARQSPTGRAWVASRIGSGSDADDGSNLNGDYGRLVGVAPEAHVAREKILEARVEAAIDAGISFQRTDGLLYVPVDRDAAAQLKR